MVTLQNYEEYMMLYVDDELDAATVKELMDFVEKHPPLRRELDAYQKTKLPAATELVYGDKNKLMKLPAITINFNRWFLYGAAASVVLLIGFVAIKWMNKPNEAVENIKYEIAKSKEIPNSVEEIPNIKEENKTEEKVPNSKLQTPNSQPQFTKMKTSNSKQKNQPINRSTNQPITAPQNLIINEIQEPAVVQQTDEPKQHIEENTNDPLQPAGTAEIKKHKRGFLARLPFSAEKKQGLLHLQQTVEDKVASVKNIKEELKNTSLELKLGNKELFVINF